MTSRAMLVLVAALHAAPAAAQEPVETAFVGVLRGCETWVFDPARWTDGPEPFLKATGLGSRIAAVETVPEALRPPPELRGGNRHWRIDASDRAGFALTVSHERPMCHIVGLGFGDFRRAVTAVLSSRAFAESWAPLDELDVETGRSLVFRHRADESFVMTLSQPAAEEDAEGGIRLLATAVHAGAVD